MRRPEWTTKLEVHRSPMFPSTDAELRPSASSWLQVLRATVGTWMEDLKLCSGAGGAHHELQRIRRQTLNTVRAFSVSHVA